MGNNFEMNETIPQSNIEIRIKLNFRNTSSKSFSPEQ
jgi:hypothetical protein